MELLTWSYTQQPTKSKTAKKASKLQLSLKMIKEAHCYGMWKVSPVTADYRDNTEKTAR